MPTSALRYALALLALSMASGCMVIAATGAVVSAGVAVGSAAVSTGVAVTKGAVKVASYPFRDSDEEKAAKARAEAEGKD
jgi:hypothetical protein